MATHVEIARFRLKADADEHTFLAAEQRIQNGEIRQQAGFIGRELVKNEAGEWSIIMHWASRADADAWSAKFMQIPDGQAFASQLDFPSMHQDHYDQVTF